MTNNACFKKQQFLLFLLTFFVVESVFVGFEGLKTRFFIFGFGSMSFFL